MKKYIPQIKFHFLILILAPIVGLLALLAVHLLPTEPMREHVYWALDMIEKEFTDELLVDGYPATLTGNFTDCLMLQYSVYSSNEHSILEQSLRMYRSESCPGGADSEDWWPGQSLVDYLHGVPQPREVEYARYWHGYLVVLKPLLLLTSVNTIRLLNSALQLILAGLVVLALTRKNAPQTAIAYLFSLPFMFFISTYASLSLSICYYVMNIAVLLELYLDSYLYQKEKYGIFFLIVGMCTSYFDFLTYPLITLVYPLCIYFTFHAEDFAKNLKKLLIYSVEWSMGYTFMWASKWILSDMLTGSNVIKDALSTIGVRTQSVEDLSRAEGFLNVLYLHIQPFANWCFFLLLLFLAIATFIQVCRVGFSKMLKQLHRCVIYIILALYPFLWFIVIQNHSLWHWQFTCRNISITIFAGLVGLITIWDNVEKTPCHQK